MFEVRQSIKGLLAASRRLNLITTELQEGAIKIRPQPIENIGTKFPRIARDLATVGDKQVRVAMGGRETDLDKTIAEAIKDPLTRRLWRRKAGQHPPRGNPWKKKFFSALISKTAT